MSDALDPILAANAAAVRKQQFVQQVKMTAAGPARIMQMQAQLAQSKVQLKARILDEQVITDLGADYDTVKAAVDAL